MMLQDKKKIVQVILGQKAAPAPEEKVIPQGIESDFGSAKDQLASELMEALKGSDAGQFAKSLSQFIALACKEEEYSEEE